MNLLLKLWFSWLWIGKVVCRLETIDQAVILENPIVSCSTKWVTFSFKTSVPFQGKIFVENMAFDNRCSAQYISNLAKNVTFRFPIRPCTKTSSAINNPNDFYSVANVQVNFHPTLVIGNSRVFKITCMDAGKNGPLENDGDANAICRHEIMKAQSNINDFLSVGDDVYHRWTCSKDYDVTKYQLMIRKCVATSRSRDSVNIIDGNGCIVDDLLMQSLKYNQEKLDAVAESKIFKFIDEPELRFGCNVVLIEKNNSTVELPKCSISTTEIRERIRKGTKSAQPYFEHGDQLYRDFSTSLSNLKYIETTTLTEWLIIKDNVEISNKNNKSDFEILASIDTALDNGAIFTEKLTIQDELQSFAPNQLPNLVNFGNVAQNLDKSVGSVGTTMSPPLEVGRTGVDIQTITPKFQTEETDEPDIIEEITENHEQNSMLKKIEQLLVDNSKKSSNKIDSGNFDEQSFDFNEFSNEKIQEKIIEKSDDSYENKNDWRLDDSFLNGTDETLISCVNELAKLNGTTRYFIEPSSSLVCSWRSVNIALFLWSLASLIIWLVFLTFKLHYFFWKKARKDRIIRQNVQNCHLVWSRTSDSYGFGDRYGSTLDPNHCKYLD